MNENRPKVGVCVLILKDSKVLLEFGESWEECVAREVAEEVGVKVKNIRYATATYVTLIMVCDYESGDVQNLEPEKCEFWEWLDWNNLPQPLFLTEENLLKQQFDPFK